MLASIVTLALLGTTVLAQEKRQATNGAQFSSAANQLVSAYIPSTALPALESAISEGAAKASVTGDAKSLIHSALLGGELPDWFVSAVPVEYSTQIDALESNINALRGTVGATLIPVVIAVTTTDSDGNTVTSSITTTAPSAPSTTDVVSRLTTQVVDGVTSVFSTAVNGASSVASEISSGGSSVVSDISSGGSSVLSDASTAVNGATSTSTAGAGIPTAVSGAAAGVLGLVGIMIAL